MGKRILIWRYGAYGDMAFTLPLIDRLKAEGHTLFLHTGFKGMQIYLHDPRFDGMTFYEPVFSRTEGLTLEEQRTQERDLQEIVDVDVETYKPDVVVNLSHTVETSMIPVRGEEAFDWPIERRRRELSPTLSFYEKPLDAANDILPFRPLEQGELGRMAYTPSEIHSAQMFRDRFKHKFIVLLAISGATAQKRFPQAAAVAKHILESYKDAVIILQADPNTIRERRHQFTDFNDGRILIPDPNGPQPPFRRSLLLARYADLVIGPETGLVCAAGIWDTPKILLATTSTIYQCVGPAKNDFSLQANTECAPCLRAIYRDDDCYRGVQSDGMTPCNHHFNLGDILDRIDVVYRTMRYLSCPDGDNRREPIQVPVLRPLNGKLPSQRGPLWKGIPREVSRVRENTSREADNASPVGDR